MCIKLGFGRRWERFATFSATQTQIGLTNFRWGFLPNMLQSIFSNPNKMSKRIYEISDGPLTVISKIEFGFGWFSVLKHTIFIKHDLN
jgi:hypothetical protein